MDKQTELLNRLKDCINLDLQKKNDIIDDLKNEYAPIIYLHPLHELFNFNKDIFKSLSLLYFKSYYYLIESKKLLTDFQKFEEAARIREVENVFIKNIKINIYVVGTNALMYSQQNENIYYLFINGEIENLN